MCCAMGRIHSRADRYRRVSHLDFSFRLIGPMSVNPVASAVIAPRAFRIECLSVQRSLYVGCTCSADNNLANINHKICATELNSPCPSDWASGCFALHSFPNVSAWSPARSLSLSSPFLLFILICIYLPFQAYRMPLELH